MNLEHLRTPLIAMSIVLVASATLAFDKADPNAKIEMLSAGAATRPVIGQDNFRTDAQEAGGQVLLLALSPGGFESSEITVPPGDYLVVVSNRTGLAELNIQVTRERDQSATTEAARGRRHAKKFIKLVSGTYVINESAHPQWVCRIIVES